MNDVAIIEIKDVGGDVVLTVSGTLDKGNHQAHPADDDGAAVALRHAPSVVTLSSGFQLSPSGFKPILPFMDNSDPNTELCNIPEGHSP